MNTQTHCSVAARVAQMEDIAQLSGVGIEDVDTGDVSESSIVRSSGSYVIRLHRQAPHRAWILEQAMAFLRMGHPAGLRSDSLQPSVTFKVITHNPSIPDD